MTLRTAKRTCRAARLVCLGALLLTWTNPAAGHDIGKTHITATFGQDGSYRVDILVDSDAILSRLDVLAAERHTAPLPPSGDHQRRLEALGDQVLSGLTIAFDGVRAKPSYEYLAPTGEPSRDPVTGALLYPPGVVRLEGRVPAGAQTFTWSYGLVYGSYALTVAARAGQSPMTQWLMGGQMSEPIPLAGTGAAPSRLDIAIQYLTLGFTHILPRGLDHILFVLGLFLLSARIKPVLLQVSTFTLAHSITLGLTIYGIVSLRPSIVEPLIALSIVYVAIENLFTSELKPWRLALVFGFGLLHGMGFAGVLTQLGLPRSEFMTALVTFNVGVEAGQLAVILTAFLIVAHWHARTDFYRRRIIVPASLLIAITGLYWTVERLFT